MNHKQYNKPKAFLTASMGLAHTALAIGALGFYAGNAAADPGYPGDFGLKMQHLLESQTNLYFGVKKALNSSAPASEDEGYRKPWQTADQQVKLAKGLSARYLTRNAGNSVDMYAWWPSDEAPTHAIACIEGGRSIIGTLPSGGAKYNPSVQSIDLASGEVRTLLRGMNRCDGIRRTAWGTILATEETTDGGAYEILSPLSLSEATVLDRATGAVTEPALVAKRQALPTMAWEGLTVLENGVVIGGDELRPGSGVLDSDGGAMFKFVPAEMREDSGWISDLADSPLVAGLSYAMTVSCRDAGSSSFPQYGQGCEVGQAAWVLVNAATARADADIRGATGYYRPEDLHRDPVYQGAGVRFCWTNTGNESAEHFGEVMCAIDPMPYASGHVIDDRSGWTYLAAAEGEYAYATVNRFVEGDQAFNSVDNLAFQPHSGNLYVIEDHDNGDIFACLPDGNDRDIKSDGCVRVLSVMDSSAEPSGFTFSGDGRYAILSIQHSDDTLMPEFDDYRTDDVLIIEGFKVKAQ